VRRREAEEGVGLESEKKRRNRACGGRKVEEGGGLEGEKKRKE
jgi:hypothetical protein